MESACHCVVFDIGGTSLRAGLYDLTRGALGARLTRETPSAASLPGAGAAEIQARLLDAMEDMARSLAGGTPGLVVAAFPGPIGADGEVLRCPTVWGDLDPRPFAAREALGRRLPGAEVLLLNDVSAAGYRFVARGDDPLCVVTVSSGIGHKIFVGGRPVVGPRGRGGEIGHWRADRAPGAPRCECGGEGHLAALSSGRGALAAARRRAAQDPAGFSRSVLGEKLGGRAEALDNRALAAAFVAGDRWAAAVIEAAARPLGHALAALHLAVGVERFVIIGGFALALGEAYRALLAREAAACAWGPAGGGSPALDWGELIELADPREPTGLLGAGHYAGLCRARAAEGSGTPEETR